MSYYDGIFYHSTNSRGKDDEFECWLLIYNRVFGGFTKLLQIVRYSSVVMILH